MTLEVKIHRQSPRRVTQSLLGGSVTYQRSNSNQLKRSKRSKRSALCRLILVLHIT
jgi:hypothetical protein